MYYPGIQFRLPCTPRTIFHGCQIVHWDPLNAKRRCPQKKFWFGLCEIAWFLLQPRANLRRGLPNKLLISQLLLILDY